MHQILDRYTFINQIYIACLNVKSFIRMVYVAFAISIHQDFYNTNTELVLSQRIDKKQMLYQWDILIRLVHCCKSRNRTKTRIHIISY